MAQGRNILQVNQYAYSYTENINSLRNRIVEVANMELASPSTSQASRDEINSLVEGSHAAADSGIHQLAEGVQLAIDLLG
jgi:hypothetical protein